jgi:hypothetical protein
LQSGLTRITNYPFLDSKPNVFPAYNRTFEGTTFNMQIGQNFISINLDVAKFVDNTSIVGLQIMTKN